MQTIERSEAQEICRDLVSSWRETFRHYGSHLAAKIDGPDAESIGAELQEQIDHAIDSAESMLLKTINDIPSVEDAT